jgi:hypothetical protein
MRLLLLALLFGATAAAADPPASTEAPDAPPLSVWRPAGSGAYEHLQSGLTCPAKYTGYRRIDVVVFDPYGLDVGCNYSGGSAAITYYLTRRGPGGSLDADMAQARRELMQAGAVRHAQLVSETRYAQDGLSWSVALYSEDGGHHSGVWVADLDGWTFEFRATYPAEHEASVLSDIRVISAAVQASAGARLALCAKAAPVQRPGAVVTDKDALQSAAMMTSLLGAAAQGAVKDGRGAVSEAPVVWCVERAQEKDGYPLLFWRGLNPDGTDARLDQASLVRQGPPVILSLAPDSLASLVEAEADKSKGKGGDKAARWTATLTQGQRVIIFAYYTDRPPVETVLEGFAAILAGKAKAVGGYSVSGKNITIEMPEK